MHRRPGTKGRPGACLLLVLAAFALALPQSARAEGASRGERLRGLFTTQQKKPAPPKRKPAGGGGRLRAAAAVPAPARKAPDARVLLVVGDALGASLAQGLAETFRDRPSVRVEWRPAPSAGLAHGEAGTWPKALAGFVGKEKPAAALVMLGSADRRRMRLESGRAALLDGAWRLEYGRRAGGLAEAAGGVPFFWIGLPPVRDAAASRDFLAFNEIVRAALPPGASFVDTWDGFADEAGGYAQRGPGVDGLAVRLRRGDGFTAAGSRKLAFFAARPLAKLLGLPASEDAGDPLPGALLRTGPLAEDAAPGDGELLGGPGATLTAPPPVAVPLDPAVPSGRADDFRAGR